MELKIQNYGQIKDAAITLKPGINLLIGGNRSGKTTVLRAIAAAASPSVAATPTGMLKKDSSNLVADGAKSASITLDDVTVKFPANTAKGNRDFISPSRIALGLDDWTAMSKSDRVAVMRQMAPGVEVTIKNLIDHLGIVESDEHFNAISNMSSVEAAHALASQKATERIGAWKHVTHANFGTSVLHTWRPEGLGPDDVDEEHAKKTIAALLVEHDAKRQARAIHVKITEMSGVGDLPEETLDALKYDEQLAALARQLDDELSTSALKIATLEDKILTAKKLKQNVDDAESVLLRCKKDLRDEKARKPPVVENCPGCGFALSIFGNKIVKSVTLNEMGPREDQITKITALGTGARQAFDAAKLAQGQFITLAELEKQMADAVADFASRKKSIKSQITDITNKKADQEAIIARANANRQWMKDNAPTGECPTEEEIFGLREAIAAHQETLRKIQQLATATEIKNDILFWGKVKETSGDQGLRKTAMEKCLAVINEQIREVADGMFFDSVLEINIDGDLLSDGRPVALMSGAERKQTNIIMQTLVAIQEKAAIILIDEAGIIFDALSRQSLFEMLAAKFADKIVVVAIAGKSASTPADIKSLCANVFNVKCGVVS